MSSGQLRACVAPIATLPARLIVIVPTFQKLTSGSGGVLSLVRSVRRGQAEEPTHQQHDSVLGDLPHLEVGRPFLSVTPGKGSLWRSRLAPSLDVVGPGGEGCQDLHVLLPVGLFSAFGTRSCVRYLFCQELHAHPPLAIDTLICRVSVDLHSSRLYPSCLLFEPLSVLYGVGGLPKPNSSTSSSQLWCIDIHGENHDGHRMRS